MFTILRRPQSHNAEQNAEPAMEDIVMLKRPKSVKQAAENAFETTLMLNALSAQTANLKALISAQTAATLEALKLDASEVATIKDQEPAYAIMPVNDVATKCKTVYRKHSFSPQGLGQSPSAELSFSKLSMNMVQNAYAEKTASAAEAARLSMLKPMEAAHLKTSKNEKAQTYSVVPTYNETTDTLCYWSVALNRPCDAAEEAILQQCSNAALEDAARASMSTEWWNVPPGLSALSRAVAKHRSPQAVSPSSTKQEYPSAVHRLSTIVEVDSPINTSPIGSDSDRALSSHQLTLLTTLKSPRSSISSNTTAAQSSSSATSAKRPDSGYENMSADGLVTVEAQGVATVPILQRPSRAWTSDSRSPNRSSASSDSSESGPSMDSSSSSSRYFSAKHSRVPSGNVEHDGEGEVADAGGVAL
jgi:hypothetical protein